MGRRLSSRRGPRGRAPLSRPGSGDARPPVTPSALRFLVPARARSPAPRSLRAPCATALRGPGTPCAQRSAGARSAGPAPRAPDAGRARAQLPSRPGHPLEAPGPPTNAALFGWGRSPFKGTDGGGLGDWDTPPRPAHRPPAGKPGPRSRSSSSQAEGRSP